MVVKLFIGVLVGAGIGAVMGHFGQCSSGTCPLAANPFRGVWRGCSRSKPTNRFWVKY